MSQKIDVPLEARQKYLERRKQDLQDCKNALESQDFKCLEKVGHQIKGNAVTFGFDQLTPIAIEIEDLAIKRDLEKLRTKVSDLAAAISEITVLQ